MASYNKLTLVGNVVRDPEIRYVDDGQKSVTKFSLAINRKAKAGDEVMFIDAVAWDRLSDICNDYLKKGMLVLVEGRLVIREYTNKDGEKRKAIEVVVSEMQMLDSKGHVAGEARSTEPRRTAAPVAAGGGGRSAPTETASKSAGRWNDDDEEIPF